jgi:hypothetical protein
MLRALFVYYEGQSSLIGHLSLALQLYHEVSLRAEGRV